MVSMPTAPLALTAVAPVGRMDPESDGLPMKEFMLVTTTKEGVGDGDGAE